ncbi:MAG: tetratricopeptide repeat protein [Magnetovibrionaceae bacterium]
MPQSKSKRKKPKKKAPGGGTSPKTQPMITASARELDSGQGGEAKLAEALEAFNAQNWRRALTLLGHYLKDHPTHLKANKMVVAAWFGEAQPLKAVPAMRIVAEQEPDNLNGLIRLAHVLIEANELPEAESWLRKALKLAPENATVLRSLGAVLRDTGQLKEAVEILKRGVAIDPRPYDMESGLIFCLDFVQDSTTAEQQAQRRAWVDRWVVPHVTPMRHDPSGQVPDRKIRVGYVSGDFRNHSAARCFGPVVLNHDRESFEVHLYSASPVYDDLSQRFRAHADGWHPVWRLKEQELFSKIQEDRIDILVDLSGFTLGNRLGALSGRPAPIQITAWGHAHGVGMPSIDFLFSDPVCVPEEERSLFPEEIADLPCLISFDAPADAHHPGPLPARTRGFVTFGCFNRIVKVTDESLALFVRVLDAVPDSRIVFKAGDFSKPGVVSHFRTFFAKAGIAEDRVTLLGDTDRAEHLAAMSSVDIALDPIPHGGGVTTFETLWQGVPVVSLYGKSVPGRVSAAILTACGLPDWVAGSEDDYVALAAAKARDRETLGSLRSGLRDQVASSDAVRPGAYVAAVEASYRAMWRRYCATGSPRSRPREGQV